MSNDLYRQICYNKSYQKISFVITLLVHLEADLHDRIVGGHGGALGPAPAAAGREHLGPLPWLPSGLAPLPATTQVLSVVGEVNN